MKCIHVTRLLLGCLLIFMSFSVRAQVRDTFRVGGDIGKYYPVVFTDSAYDRDEASELRIGRAGTHRDGEYGSFRGSLIATFRYHTYNWGNASSFIDADIRQSSPKYNTFIGGWQDATRQNGAKIIIIWLRGNTSYSYSSRYNDKVFVYDGSPTGPLPYTEPNSPGTTYNFKTVPDSYVNTYGSTYSSNAYFAENVGIGTAAPTARLEIANAKPWTSAGWGRAIKLQRLQSLELEAGSKKFGIGASFDSLLTFFATDTDTAIAPIRYHMAITNLGNVGIGTGLVPATAKLEIGGAAAWTSAGWGKALKLQRAQSMALDAGSKKFGIGASYDSLLVFFSTDTDTAIAPIRNHMVITNTGNVGIGTFTPNSYKLAVEGTLGARRIKVTQQGNWADFVFHPEYKLPALNDVEQFIQKNGHLLEIPTAADVKENGVDVGEMNKLLLQKVEELTLYLIQQQKEINELKRQIKQP